MENTPTWNVEQVWGSDRFYSEGDVAEGQFAFVIDSGVAKLDDLNVNEQWSKSFVAGFDDPFDDITGHGTAVASVIGAKANQQGLTGVAPGAQIVALRVFGDRGWARGSDIDDALRHARDVIVSNDLYDKAVVNLSLGGGYPDNHPIIKEMADLGIKITISAGNSARDVDGYSPASYGHMDNVYTVSANTVNGTYSHFTNFDGVDLNNQDDTDYTAPGSWIPTYNIDGTIGNRNGTSFSSPHVAGLLLMSDEIRPGQTFEMDKAQIAKGMVADPLAMFDPYTYKHGPSTGDPTPAPPPESIAPIVGEPPTTPEPEPEPQPDPEPQDPRVKIKGDRFDNVITGGDNRDKLRGLKGNDTITSFAGDDIIRGGQGNDVLDAGTGADIITCGLGMDIVANQRDGDIDYIFIRPETDPDNINLLRGLDAIDRIIIKDAWDEDISVTSVEAGVGIWFNDQLQAVYTAFNLTVAEVQDMVIGA